MKRETAEEKFNRFLQSLNAAVAGAPIWSSDKALYHLLHDNATQLSEWFREAKGSEYTFQKFFRQLDVLESADMDMAIWHLIGKSELFSIVWQEFHKRKKKAVAPAC